MLLSLQGGEGGGWGEEEIMIVVLDSYIQTKFSETSTPFWFQEKVKVINTEN